MHSSYFITTYRQARYLLRFYSQVHRIRCHCHHSLQRNHREHLDFFKRVPQRNRDFPVVPFASDPAPSCSEAKLLYQKLFYETHVALNPSYEKLFQWLRALLDDIDVVGALDSLPRVAKLAPIQRHHVEGYQRTRHQINHGGLGQVKGANDDFAHD